MDESARILRLIIREELLGTSGGVQYYQMGGSLPKEKYNLDDEGRPTDDPGVAVLRRTYRRRKKKTQGQTPAIEMEADEPEDTVISERLLCEYIRLIIEGGAASERLIRQRKQEQLVEIHRIPKLIDVLFETKNRTDQIIQSTLRVWVEDGKKGEEGPYWFPPRELFRYREYHRRSRPDLQKSMRKKGFDPKYPIRLEFGRNGEVKVGEGNHRLKTAIQLGLDEVPVIFRFENEVTKGTEARSEWQQTQDRKNLQKQQKEKRDASFRAAWGIKDLTPEERDEKLSSMSPEEREQRENEIEELMGLIGF